MLPDSTRGAAHSTFVLAHLQHGIPLLADPLQVSSCMETFGVGGEGQEAAAVLLVRSCDYDEGADAVVAAMNPFDQQGLMLLLGSYYYYRLLTNPTGVTCDALHTQVVHLCHADNAIRMMYECMAERCCDWVIGASTDLRICCAVCLLSGLPTSLF
jgi:hypothetical protein